MSPKAQCRFTPESLSHHRATTGCDSQITPPFQTRLRQILAAMRMAAQDEVIAAFAMNVAGML